VSHLGLERITNLLERMGRPQDSLRFVHVGGTNGKGSSCAYLSRILEEAGYKVALFTSPAIIDFEERMRINGCNIPRETLADIVEMVRPLAAGVEQDLGEHPTEFELMTACALEYFKREVCDIVVFEVGLGGRLDATNIIENPEACIITNIGLDHVEQLGNTIAAVAGEKAGIIKPSCPVISWPHEPEAMEVIERVAEAQGAALRVPDFSQLESKPLEGKPLRHFSYRGVPYTTRLLGNYQPANATMVLECVDVLRERGWKISEEAVASGMAHAFWPGRFEVVGTTPLTIIDGGHNAQGAEALVSSLEDLLGPQGRGRVTFVFGVLSDKDYDAMIEHTLPWAKRFVAYTPHSVRALPGETLVEAVKSHAYAAGLEVPVYLAESPAAALQEAQEEAGAEGVVVAFGSLYAIGDLLDSA
jgi:dihydrofolate synthase/folylpolyglutamate synthase